MISGVNIHTYGNLWIYPFNYKKDPLATELRKKHRSMYEFLKEFKKEINQSDHLALFGNSSITVEYPSNGEAGDWFTGAKNILNLDVELGNKAPESNKFYPPKNILYSIITYNWNTFSRFLNHHAVDLTIKKLIIYKKSRAYNFQV